MTDDRPTYVSLFAGAGGFDMGFDAAGFRCAAQVEIDKTARAVLARHWPDVPRFPDVRAFGKAQVPHADVVVGGFPCQDVSTAGLRKGFEGGERSSLWFEMARVVRELRPAYVAWENVPGLLSADEGRAFGWVLRELADLGFDGGWRTVDAQFFGVPQQRRRVFGVFARGRAGARRAAEVLALAESGRRRTPPRRKKGAGVAAGAEGRTGGGSELYPCLRSNPHNNSDPGMDARMLVVFGGGDASGERGADAALSAKGGTGRQDFDTENFVLSVGCQAPDATPKGRDDGLAYTLTGRRERGHGHGVAVCVTRTVTHTLTGEGHDAGEDGTGRGVPVVFNWQSGGDCRVNPSELPDAQGVGQTPAVLYQCHGSNVGPAGTVRRGNGGVTGGVPFLASGSVVRRLTPRECERLMGWPDDFTRYRADGAELKDGPRYRLCGNGVVGTVSRWLAVRLMGVMRGEGGGA